MCSLRFPVPENQRGLTVTAMHRICLKYTAAAYPVVIEIPAHQSHLLNGAQDEYPGLVRAAHSWAIVGPYAQAAA